MARPTDIARALGINSGSVVRLVDALVDDGLAERNYDAPDRRVRRVCLTSLGEKTARAADQQIRDHEASLLSRLDETELDAALKALRLIEAGLAIDGHSAER